MIRRRALASLLLVLAAGCALLPPPDPAAVRREAMPNLQAPDKWTGQGAASGAVAAGWLAGFNDSQLDAIVREALAYNPDLLAAAARVEQAAGYARLAGATLYPQVNIMGR